MREQATVYDRLRVRVQNDDPVALVSVVAGPPALLGTAIVIEEDDTLTMTPPQAPAAWLDEAVGLARAALRQGEASTTIATLNGPDGALLDCYIEVLQPPPHLVIVGGVHVGMILCRLAKELGYMVTVTDARPPFVTRERFPLADRILIGWPDDTLPTLRLTPRTAVAVLTHDPKFDEPALKTVLATAVGYVGAIGSRKTRQEHHAHLREQGVSEEALRRVHGPIGLDLGGKSPAEIALAIMAEVVAVRFGRVLVRASTPPVVPA